jgi:hypothetical protein
MTKTLYTILLIALIPMLIFIQIILGINIHVATSSLLTGGEMFALVIAFLLVCGVIWYLFIEHIITPIVKIILK